MHFKLYSVVAFLGTVSETRLRKFKLLLNGGHGRPQNVIDDPRSSAMFSWRH